jgi:SAM-dependent methyltransferase
MADSADEATLNFYGQEAKRYSERTGLTATASLGQFLACLPLGASILELGCGSGRDSAEMLRQGYNVAPTDGSPEMARQAERRVRRPVAVLQFGEIAGEAKFHGVWACGCLLHVPVGSLSVVVTLIHRVLRPNGVLFASFKAGQGEGRDRFGRYYNYLSLVRLREVFEGAAPWASLQIREVPGVGYDAEPVIWLNCLAMKP